MLMVSVKLTISVGALLLVGFNLSILLDGPRTVTDISPPRDIERSIARIVKG
jgi:hypothetical protein